MQTHESFEKIKGCEMFFWGKKEENKTKKVFLKE